MSESTDYLTSQSLKSLERIARRTEDEIIAIRAALDGLGPKFDTLAQRLNAIRVAIEEHP